MAMAVAAHLKDNVEHNEDGTFYYKFPPFPKPSSVPNLVPFSDFQDFGIEVRPYEEDVEMDGRGIPTVRLGVKHDNDAPVKKKSKKKRNALGQWVGPNAKDWWDEWPDPNEIRVSNLVNYDPKRVSAAERIEFASDEFFQSRAWPPMGSGVTQLFDQFRLFMGLIGDGMQTIYRKEKREECEEDEESDDDETAGPIIPQQQLKKVEKDAPSSLIDQPQSASQATGARRPATKKTLVTKEERLESFLSHLEFSIRVFLSSYFREKGMYWSEIKLRDGPIIVLYYLKYLKSHRVLPEMENQVHNAIQFAEKAVHELPQTKKLGAVLPDQVSEGCAKLFGSKTRKIEWIDPAPKDAGATTPDDKPAEKMDKVEQTPTAESPVKDSEMKETSAWGAPGGWGDNTVTDAPNGWGAAIFDATTDPGPGLGWGGPMEANGFDDEDNAVNSWVTSNTSGWDRRDKEFLFPLLGPTTFPLTHTTGYVEASVRRIVSWKMPPDPKSKDYVPGDLESTFASVVMEPWGSWDDDEHAAIRPPDLIETPSENLAVHAHDPKRSNIRLLVLPKVAETLLKGMGLGGVWVQVVPNATRIEETKRKNKNWWYLENLDQILVSFWTEA